MQFLIELYLHFNVRVKHPVKKPLRKRINKKINDKAIHYSNLRAAILFMQG